MTIDQYRRKLEKLYVNRPRTFFKEVVSQQNEQYSLALELIARLQTNDAGQIIANTQNLGLIEATISSLKASFYNEDYLNATNGLVSTMDETAKLSDEWFRGEFNINSLTDLAEPARLMNEVTKRQTTELLMGTSAIDANFFNPIKETLLTGVQSGQRITELNKSIRGVIKGSKEYDGKLLRYSKQIASDSVTTADRAYTDKLSKSFDVDFYTYSGGLLTDSRKFCVDRDGKYFHKKEVEEWGTVPKTWKGRYRGTDGNTIFQWCGGYNCKHSLIPVSAASVPFDVIGRAYDKGYYKPTDAELAELGIDEKLEQYENQFDPYESDWDVESDAEDVEDTIAYFKKKGHPINFAKIKKDYEEIVGFENRTLVSVRGKKGDKFRTIAYKFEADDVSLARSFSIDTETGELFVERELFEISEDYQGKGWAGFIVEKEFDYYKELNPAKLLVNTGLSRGGYAWAKYGARATDMYVVEDILDIAATMGKITPYDKDVFTQMAINEHIQTGSYDLSIYANQPWGNDVLSGMHYSAFWDVNNNEQMDILYSYVSSRKAKYLKYLESGDY